MAVAFLVVVAASSRADIYRWDNGELVPGTEGVEPGPLVQLDHRELVYAELANRDLSGSRFDASNLSHALFYGSTLLNATFDQAVVIGADFSFTTAGGFTQQQLYSTASYYQKNLQGITLFGNDLSGWDFEAQDLSGAHLDFTVLAGASLARANLRSALFAYSDVVNADFTKADLASASFYQADASNANLAGANLANAVMNVAVLDHANLSTADTRGAQGLDLTNAISRNAVLPDGSVAGLDLSGSIQLAVRNYHGDASRGIGPIPVKIQNRMTMGDGSLQLAFDGDAWDSTITFQAGIPVALGGSLELLFAPGVDPLGQVGRTFDIFDWTGVNPTGQFQVESAYAWDLSRLYSTGEVTLIASSPDLPGDINLDDVVNRQDAAIFARYYGKSANSTWSTGDFDADGATTLADLAMLQAHLTSPNSMPAASLNTAVPEPSAMLLTTCGLVAVLFARRRRRNANSQH